MINILVVDDEPDIDFLMTQRYRRAIKEHRLHFFFARNGQEALKVLKNQSDIDIMVTDINMPVMDGIELLSRSADLYPNIKKYALSAYSDRDSMQQAERSGAVGFIVKPIEFSNFEEKLGISQ